MKSGRRDQALLIFYRFYIGVSEIVLKSRLVSVLLCIGKKTACASTYINVQWWRYDPAIEKPNLTSQTIVAEQRFSLPL